MKEQEKIKVAFCTPWQGRRDGISDLVQTYIGQLGGMVDLEIVSLRRNIASRQFYRRAEERINHCDLCHLQHNYVYFNGFLPARERFTSFLRRLRVPLLITFHEYRDHYPVLPLPSWTRPSRRIKRLLLNQVNHLGMKMWLKAYHQAAFQRADRIQVHTNYHRQLLLELGCPPQKIFVFPLPAATFLTPPEPGKPVSSGRWPGKRVILTPGFVSRRKGYEVVFPVLRELPDDILYIIAGGAMNRLGDVYRKQLEASIHRYNLEERVKITGYCPPAELSRLMLNADLILLPYPEEVVQGSAALSQAISLELPVLTSSIRVHREIREHSGCLELFDLSSPDSLREKIIRLLERPQLRNHLLQACRQYRRKFAPGQVARKLSELYREMAQR